MESSRDAVIAADVERGTVELAFAATEAFTNPRGNVLGAFVAAMLYDRLGRPSAETDRESYIYGRLGKSTTDV